MVCRGALVQVVLSSVLGALVLKQGPSQLETFDMKPDAPSTLRGPFRPIASRTPELQICEHLPKLAGMSGKFCVVRTMSHPYNDHSGAGHYIQTGRPWHIPIGGGFNATSKDWPSMGSTTPAIAPSASEYVGVAATLPVAAETRPCRPHRRSQRGRPVSSAGLGPSSAGRLVERRRGHPAWCGPDSGDGDRNDAACELR